MFIDEASILVNAGNGGHGCVSFERTSAFKRRPDGGDGGRGGHVWLSSDHNLTTLHRFSYQRHFRAEHGRHGLNRRRTGRNGADTVVTVPVGTRVFVGTSFRRRIVVDLVRHRQAFLVARGGMPGLGSAHFRTNHRRVQSIETHGTPGESRKIQLQLLLLADVGTVGLPNSGKSTFVRSVSGARTKSGRYPFTTLHPVLGTTHGPIRRFVVADVPGLIRGSSCGKGLGVRFLKHLERCRMLLHIVDVSCNPRRIVKDVRVVLSELRKHNASLLDKPHWIVFNKIDRLRRKHVRKRVEWVRRRFSTTHQYGKISALFSLHTKTLCARIADFLHELDAP